MKRFVNAGGPSSKINKFVWDLLESVGVAVILAIVIRIFLFEPFYIPSWSMSPILKPGDKIIVNKFTYRISQPKRGDIVVFKYPKNPKKDYIKRIIGLPGETIKVRNNKVFVDERELVETYLSDGLIYPDFGPVVIDNGKYFMMGDNRSDSLDSRYWGTLDRKLMLGEAMVIFWPISRLEVLY